MILWPGGVSKEMAGYVRCIGRDVDKNFCSFLSMMSTIGAWRIGSAGRLQLHARLRLHLGHLLSPSSVIVCFIFVPASREYKSSRLPTVYAQGWPTESISKETASWKLARFNPFSRPSHSLGNRLCPISNSLHHSRCRSHNRPMASRFLTVQRHQASLLQRYQQVSTSSNPKILA
jgi:hypothetical protein